MEVRTLYQLTAFRSIKKNAFRDIIDQRSLHKFGKKDNFIWPVYSCFRIG